MHGNKGNIPTSGLNQDERIRYQRHFSLPEVGVQGQMKLKASRVLVIGAGGLGSPAAYYLAAAGIGHLGVVDHDTVDASNLQRQILHATSSVGRLKVESARARLTDLNPHVDISIYPERLSGQNVMALFSDYDIVVDGTDNFPTRYLANDACALLGKPYVYGSIFRFEGQAGFFWAGHGGCYRCLYPRPPPHDAVPSCAEGGVLGALPGIIGAIQATETMKWIVGCGEILLNRLLLLDALTMRFRELKFSPDPSCPVCGDLAFRKNLEDFDYNQACHDQLLERKSGTMNEITATELKQRLDRGDRIMIVDVREPHELAIAKWPGACPIPLGQIVQQKDELDPQREVVVMCRSGGRSAKAIQDLRLAGYTGPLTNLKGGILSWSTDVDPSIPRY